MAMSWLTRWFRNTLRPVRRPVRTKVHHGRFVPTLEALDERVMPTITASFSAAGGVLRVAGDALDNTIVVSRNVGGTILVNNGAIAIQGDLATVANTNQIFINGGAGNDNLSLDETNGKLPGASIFGGDGNDILIGGSGSDFVDGGAGNDTVFLGAGDDTFQWNPGDGSDVVDGGTGTDSMVFNGSDAAEKIDISANGNHVRFTRDVGNVVIDLTGVEEIDFNALGSADTITVNDLTATDVVQVNLDLNSSANSGDGQPDAVIVNGTAGDDAIPIAAFDNGTRIAVGGLAPVVNFSSVSSVASAPVMFPMVNITGAEAANATLTVNALGGNDQVDASNLPANLIGLTLNGGAGADVLIGSQGSDLVIGGPGTDAAQLGDGNDTFVWNPGDGSDRVDGQGGSDRLVFNGSDAAEKIDVSANGSGVDLTRDVGNVTMRLDAVEDVDFNALGGADTITVNDLTGTGLATLNLNLAAADGGPDGQADNVVVNGTNGDDHIVVAATVSNGVKIGGLASDVRITAPDAGLDQLTINGLGGNDMVDASRLPANLIGLTANLGDGQVPTAGFVYDPATKVLTITGSAVQNSFNYSQASTVDATGTLHTTYTFTLNGATETFADTELSGVVVNGQGTANTAILITSDTFTGADGKTHETVEAVQSGPGGGTVFKVDAQGNASAFLTLSGFQTSFAYVGRADSAQLKGVVGGGIENVFVTAGNYSYIFGGGEFHLVSGAAAIYGFAVNPTDQALHYDAAGSLDAFVASGNAFSYLSGSDTTGNAFFNVAVGFHVNYGISTHGNAIAYLIDSPGNDGFAGDTTVSFLSGSDSAGSLFNVAEGFLLTNAQSFVGGTDFAHNHDPQHNLLSGDWILLP